MSDTAPQNFHHLPYARAKVILASRGFPVEILVGLE